MTGWFIGWRFGKPAGIMGAILGAIIGAWAPKSACVAVGIMACVAGTPPGPMPSSRADAFDAEVHSSPADTFDTELHPSPADIFDAEVHPSPADIGGPRRCYYCGDTPVGFLSGFWRCEDC